MATQHLDIGCGTSPRNPFSQDLLYGLDILNLDNSELDFEYVRSDAVLEKLPFEDSFFDSISCYDFLEHIPRTIHRNSKIEFSFIGFMNEVHRILKPGAFCLSFCSPQLYHRMATAVDDAGFEIKDQIMWMVTTKMPKKNRLKQGA